jgi:hypothetical protein
MSQRLQHFAGLLGAALLVLVLWIATLDPADSLAIDPPMTHTPTPARPTITPATHARQHPTQLERVASLAGQGRLLFICKGGAALCLLDADGAQLRTIAADDSRARYSSPRWSPDGRFFAAIRLSEGDPAHNDEPSSSPAAQARLTGDVLLFDAEGQLISTFAPGPDYLLGWSRPAWSPDSRWLAVQGVRDQNRNGLTDEDGVIWILDRDTKLTPVGLPIAGGVIDEIDTLAWSPDGTYLAFLGQPLADSQSKDGGRAIWITRAGRGSQQLIADGSDFTWLSESRLAIVNRHRTALEIHQLGRIGTETLVTEQHLQSFLSHDDPWLPPGRLRIRWPVASPDGRHIAFRVWGEADESSEKYFPGMLFTISAHGGDLRRWPDTDVFNSGLQRWSPDSRRLIYPYWLNGNGRYHPDPSEAKVDRRWTYGEASGLIVVDLGSGTHRDEPGLGFPIDSWGAWSREGWWFATHARHPQTGIAIISATDPARRYRLSDLEASDIQWQPE